MHGKTIIRSLRNTILALPLAGAMLLAMPAHGQGQPPQADMQISKEQRQQVVDRLIAELKLGYVFPEKAKQLEQALQRYQRSAGYAAITSANQLAEELTTQIRQQTGDLHLRVRYSEKDLPLLPPGGTPSPQVMAEQAANMRGRNYGVERVERLPCNVGYLKLNEFAPAQYAGETLAAAMTMMSNLDGLIIDLRDNGGGSPETVALLASYVLDERTRLNDNYYRIDDLTEQNWSTTFVAGKPFGQQKPLYILTSKRTFSAAEDFSYAMKNLKRATIVGETTGGGAHPGRVVRLDAHFGAFVPTGRSISPITHTNWEGVGVAPDVAAAAKDALRVAQTALLNDLLKTASSEQQTQRLKQRLDAIGKES